MSQTIDQQGARPLTVLSEDEEMFRASVREFAEGELRPRAQEMDEHGKLDPSLIKQCFDLGLMGIETPEEYGGAGAGFFTAIIAVEELSRVDPSVGEILRPSKPRFSRFSIFSHPKPGRHVGCRVELDGLISYLASFSLK